MQGSPNSFFERFYPAQLDEHFRFKGRRTCFETIEEMQAALDDYLAGYNTWRPHQGRGMNRRTPIRAFTVGMPKNQQHGGDQPAENCQTQSRLRAASNAVTIRGIS
ncbi:MAG: transposase [Rhodocyclaceae bacterium]|nr:transposase [Rhodocyclaceae bacterium]